MRHHAKGVFEDGSNRREVQRSDDDAGSNARLYKEGTGGRRGRAEVRTQGQEYHKLRALTHTHTSRQAQKNAKLSGLEAAHTHMPSSIKQPMRARLSLLLGWQIDAPLRSPILTKLSYEVSLKKKYICTTLRAEFRNRDRIRDFGQSGMHIRQTR